MSTNKERPKPNKPNYYNLLRSLPFWGYVYRCLIHMRVDSSCRSRPGVPLSSVSSVGMQLCVMCKLSIWIWEFLLNFNLSKSSKHFQNTKDTRVNAVTSRWAYWAKGAGISIFLATSMWGMNAAGLGVFLIQNEKFSVVQFFIYIEFDA